jgi:hypothetical protein
VNSFIHHLKLACDGEIFEIALIELGDFEVGAVELALEKLRLGRKRRGGEAVQIDDAGQSGLTAPCGRGSLAATWYSGQSRDQRKRSAEWRSGVFSLILHRI